MPGFGKGRVLGLELLFAVEVAGDLGARHRHSERVPLLVARDLGAGELGPLAVLDLVDAEVVLERVVAADVVVVLVLGPPDQAAAAVDLAGDGPAA